jgi:hypothetical protein
MDTKQRNRAVLVIGLATPFISAALSFMGLGIEVFWDVFVEKIPPSSLLTAVQEDILFAEGMFVFTIALLWVSIVYLYYFNGISKIFRFEPS